MMIMTSTNMFPNITESIAFNATREYCICANTEIRVSRFLDNIVPQNEDLIQSKMFLQYTSSICRICWQVMVIP